MRGPDGPSPHSWGQNIYIPARKRYHPTSQYREWRSPKPFRLLLFVVLFYVYPLKFLFGIAFAIGGCLSTRGIFPSLS
jgi:hypothetical protein